MAPKRSAGILLYRRAAKAVGDVSEATPDDVQLGDVQVLLGHMGGPFWAHRDAGAWSIIKGEYVPAEEPQAAARREFEEELGLPAPDAELLELGSVRQSGGKTVTAWAAEGDLDVTRIVPGVFNMEWPRGSGQIREFPEVDRAEWLDLTIAYKKIVASQRPFLDRLWNSLHG